MGADVLFDCELGADAVGQNGAQPPITRVI
jgi:hypothetical protein